MSFNKFNTAMNTPLNITPTVGTIGKAVVMHRSGFAETYEELAVDLEDEETYADVAANAFFLTEAFEKGAGRNLKDGCNTEDILDFVIEEWEHVVVVCTSNECDICIPF